MYARSPCSADVCAVNAAKSASSARFPRRVGTMFATGSPLCKCSLIGLLRSGGEVLSIKMFNFHLVIVLFKVSAASKICSC